MKLATLLAQDQAIQLHQTALSWQGAVRQALRPLLSAGAVTGAYYEAILAATKKHGTYYLLAPEVVMPHAAPEAGVLREAVSLLTLSQPVQFPGGKSVSVLLLLAGRREHLTRLALIPQIVALLDMENALAQLKACQTPEQIYALLEQSQASPYLQGLDLDIKSS